MSDTGTIVTISPRDYDAVLFDLDGVLTRTADGVARYETAVALVQSLRDEEVSTAVVSSSVNCQAVLEKAGIAGLFDKSVDGLDVQQLGLEGEPAPDAYLEAAHRLRVQPARAARFPSGASYRWPTCIFQA